MYKVPSDYMSSSFTDEDEPKYFLVRQEIVTVIEYNVEAENMVDAIQQIENGNTDCIVDEDAIGEEHNKKGRIISVRVNDDD